MEEIIESFFGKIAQKGLENMSEFTENLFSYYLKFENIIGKFAPALNFSDLYTYVAGISLGLAIMLFLKKGFEIYVLWNDGDSDLDVGIFLAAFIKMVVVIVWFNTLFGYGVEIATNLQTKLFASFINNTTGKDFFTALISKLNILDGILNTVFAIIMIINYIRLTFQFYERGIELFILRLGVPLIALDILNSDAVAWRAYTKKMIQVVITLILQIFLFSLSFIITIDGLMSFVFAISIQLTALKLPSFLSEILVVGQGNGGLISKASTGAHLVSSIKNIVSRR